MSLIDKQHTTLHQEFWSIEDCKTYSLMTRSGAKQSMLPLHCWYDLQPRPKDMRKSQEHCSKVIWSSRCRFLKPNAQQHTYTFKLTTIATILSCEYFRFRFLCILGFWLVSYIAKREHVCLYY